VYLLQILDFIEKIESYTHGGRDGFMASPMIKDADISNFETIGEAVKQVSKQYRQNILIFHGEILQDSETY
jgi:uncharacterized protein with HEPN domain